jgi:hypothetical protein
MFDEKNESRAPGAYTHATIPIVVDPSDIRLVTVCREYDTIGQVYELTKRPDLKEAGRSRGTLKLELSFVDSNGMPLTALVPILDVDLQPEFLTSVQRSCWLYDMPEPKGDGIKQRLIRWFGHGVDSVESASCLRKDERPSL